VTRCIDNQQTRNLNVKVLTERNFFDKRGSLFDAIKGHICGTNVLRDTASFTVLDICSSKIVEAFGLSGVDVAKNADNWTSVIALNRLFFVVFSSLLDSFVDVSDLEEVVRSRARLLDQLVRIGFR
jgi:hypothetical protein